MSEGHRRHLQFLSSVSLQVPWVPWVLSPSSRVRGLPAVLPVLRVRDLLSVLSVLFRLGVLSVQSVPHSCWGVPWVLSVLWVPPSLLDLWVPWFLSVLSALFRLFCLFPPWVPWFLFLPALLSAL